MTGFVKILSQIGTLKFLPRAGWVRRGVRDPESVASHIFRTALLAVFLAPKLSVDTEKLLKIILVHDLAESDPHVGDITPFDGVSTEEKSRRERTAMERMCRSLPYGADVWNAWLEFEENATQEARVAREFDALEMALQAAEYERGQHVDLSDFFVDVEKRVHHPVLRTLFQCIRRT